MKAALGISYVSVIESRVPPASWIQNQAVSHVQEETSSAALSSGVDTQDGLQNHRNFKQVSSGFPDTDCILKLFFFKKPLVGGGGGEVGEKKSPLPFLIPFRATIILFLFACLGHKKHQGQPCEVFHSLCIPRRRCQRN